MKCQNTKGIKSPGYWNHSFTIQQNILKQKLISHSSIDTICTRSEDVLMTVEIDFYLINVLLGDARRIFERGTKFSEIFFKFSVYCKVCVSHYFWYILIILVYFDYFWLNSSTNCLTSIWKYSEFDCEWMTLKMRFWNEFSYFSDQNGYGGHGPMPPALNTLLVPLYSKWVIPISPLIWGFLCNWNKYYLGYEVWHHRNKLWKWKWEKLYSEIFKPSKQTWDNTTWKKSRKLKK